ncbi:MAG: GxxExxY protein [Desulfuromonadales bacterium]|jgi:GxxExxY protein
MDSNELTSNIIGAAIQVHRELGPGLLESVYEKCLTVEFIERKINFKRQEPIGIQYKQEIISSGLRLDLIVEDSVIIELKSVDKILPIHKAQLLSYLKLSRKKLGLLINFNVEILKDGIVRLAN